MRGKRLNKQHTPIIAVVPVLMPHGISGKRHQLRAEKAFDELLQFSGKINGGPHVREPITIFEDAKGDIWKRFPDFRKTRPFRLTRYLVFSLSARYEPRDWRYDANKETIEPRYRYPAFCVTQHTFIEDVILKLFYAANLAAPGALDFDEGCVISPAQRDSTSRRISGLEWHYPTKKKRWPVVSNMPVQQAFDWLNKLVDFEIGCTISPAGRAFGAFSYLFSSEFTADSPLDNLWSLIGLEAIFRTNGSQRDLAEKIALFLESGEDLRDRIQAIYKARSALIHGGADFPIGASGADGTSQFDRYMSRQMELEDSSVPLLIATLQKLIRLQIYEIRFKQVLV